MNYRLAFLAACLLSLATAATAAEKPWIEVRSPHFRVLTDASQRDARQVAHEFEQMRAVFADRYPQFRLEGGAPLLIFAARDESTAKSLEPAEWRTKGAKPAGIYHHAWEKEYVMVRMDEWNQAGREEEARQVVYHEYTHSLLHLNLHWLPVWLDEGMANYYGYTRFQGNKIYVGAPPTRPEQMPRQPLIPIETLIGVNQFSPYYHDEDKIFQFYAESWALVHFMMWGPGMNDGKRLNQFASLLQQGVEQKKAFQQAFGSFADMDKALGNYVSKFAFQTGVMTSPPQIDDKTFSTRTLTVAETEAELSGYHLWTHDLTGARTLAQQATKDDPKLGLAHEVMGFVDFADAKDAEALNQFSQAYSLDPTLWLSLFAKTMMSPIATSNLAGDEDAFQAALLKVLSLDPQFAPAYVQLTMLSLRHNDLQSAFGLSRKAEELEPTRAGYHTMSGQILLRMGKGSEAAEFAKYVADRWTGSDHNEAVELWNRIPPAERPAGMALANISFGNTQTVEGRILSVHCPALDKDRDQETLTLKAAEKTLIFRRHGPFGVGFTDTIWYGEDHFSFCHHLEGMRAIVQYRAPSDSTYAGDLADIEIRDDLPSPLQKETRESAAAPPAPKP
ncbi:MAG TPA: hypothetical protein VMD99_08390 [Terriglobales bacterium]|nr:hypothetical protein [Terriglobales bacterium]